MENGSISVNNILEKDGKKLLQWLAVLLVGVGALLYFFFLREDKKNPQQALDATYFALSHASVEEIPQEMAAFQSALNANPTLAPNYQGFAAQALLEKGAVVESLLLLNPLFQRVGIDQYPSFKSFTDISLIISEGNLNEALNQSLLLQASLENQPTLFAHNLIRIALLQKMLGLPEYQESLSLIKSNINTEAFKKAIDCYSYKNLGLFSFFET